jgi:L-lactate dehydrogenase complex protein LldG
MRKREDVSGMELIDERKTFSLSSLNSLNNIDKTERLRLFIDRIRKKGVSVYEATSKQDVISQVEDLYPFAKKRFSNLKGTPYFNTISNDGIKLVNEKDSIDVLVLGCNMAVVEGAGFWLQDEILSMQSLPFHSKRLVLVVDRDELVLRMHDVIEKVENTENGVLIMEGAKSDNIYYSSFVKRYDNLKFSVFVI